MRHPTPFSLILLLLPWLLSCRTVVPAPVGSDNLDQAYLVALSELTPSASPTVTRVLCVGGQDPSPSLVDSFRAMSPAAVVPCSRASGSPGPQAFTQINLRVLRVESPARVFIRVGLACGEYCGQTATYQLGREANGPWRLVQVTELSQP